MHPKASNFDNDARLKNKAIFLFNELAESYDRFLRLLPLYQDNCWKRWLLKEANLRKGWKILDLGCGTCVLEEGLAKNDYVLAGLDITEAMVRIAHRKHIESIDVLIVADAEVMPLPSSSFDIVLSCYLMKYCLPDSIVKEVRRILRPGGKFVCYDLSKPQGLFAPFHAFYIFIVMRTIGKILQYRRSNVSSALIELPMIISRTSWERQLEDALENNGFSNVGKKILALGVITGFSATKT